MPDRDPRGDPAPLPDHCPHPTMATAPDDLFDYRQTRDFARAYLRTYYAGEPPADERRLSQFLTAQAPRLPRGRFLELGCGPTVHHLLPLVPHVAELHVRDYLDDNLREVRAWRAAAPDAHDWRRFTRAALRDAGVPADDAAVAAREALVRQRLVGIAPCDLMQEAPAADRGAFAAVGCFYVAEEVGVTLPAWRLVMRRVADHVAPGGTLLLAALAGMSSYAMAHADGRVEHLPCAAVDVADVRALLPALGFAPSATSIERCAIPVPDVGVTAILLVAATKAD